MERSSTISIRVQCPRHALIISFQDNRTIRLMVCRFILFILFIFANTTLQPYPSSLSYCVGRVFFNVVFHLVSGESVFLIQITVSYLPACCQLLSFNCLKRSFLHSHLPSGPVLHLSQVFLALISKVFEASPRVS